MTPIQFQLIASQDMFRAIWVAKYYGVAAVVVKAWVAATLSTIKK